MMPAVKSIGVAFAARITIGKTLQLHRPQPHEWEGVLGGSTEPHPELPGNDESGVWERKRKRTVHRAKESQRQQAVTAPHNPCNTQHTQHNFPNRNASPTVRVSEWLLAPHSLPFMATHPLRCTLSGAFPLGAMQQRIEVLTSDEGWWLRSHSTTM
jgi:hypothetical protein